MGQVQLVRRPRRWDQPLAGDPLRQDLVDQILCLPVLSGIDARDFPDDLSLRDIITNDSRILKFTRGDILYRKGSFGTSLYTILSGSVRGLLTSEGEDALKRHEATTWKSPLHNWFRRSSAKAGGTEPRLNKTDRLVAKYPTLQLGSNGIFGELEALTRSARTATVFADTDNTLLLEIRWPGIRDLRHWSDAFRNYVDGLYRQRALENGLRQCPLFDRIDPETLKIVAESSHFKSFGRFGWTHDFKRAGNGAPDAGHEPVILEQGDYLDDVLVIGAGFARLSETFNRGEQTVGYLERGAVFGLTEFLQSRRNKSPRCALHSLRAIGYLDAIAIPMKVFEAVLLPALPHAGRFRPSIAEQCLNGAGTPGPMLDFSLDNRFINGTRAMVIDRDRCVNCDDCVRACAATHDNIPRFVRHGPTHNNLIIANACMHCIDPVCLIDCPTGAIHRNSDTGSVVIDDATCVGCGTCSAACPYGNIQMEEVRNSDGAFHIGEDGAHVLRATKCDFCVTQSGGPACQRACPHDALIRVDIKDSRTLADWLKHAR